MSLRSVLYFSLCGLAAIVVASASANLEDAQGLPPPRLPEVTVALAPWASLSGLRGLSLCLGIGALGAMYAKVWRGYH